MESVAPVLQVPQARLHRSIYLLHILRTALLILVQLPESAHAGLWVCFPALDVLSLPPSSEDISHPIPNDGRLRGRGLIFLAEPEVLNMEPPLLGGLTEATRNEHNRGWCSDATDLQTIARDGDTVDKGTFGKSALDHMRRDGAGRLIR